MFLSPPQIMANFAPPQSQEGLRDLDKLLPWLRELKEQLKAGDAPLVYSRISRTIDIIQMKEMKRK